MRIGADGRLCAINPEYGFFGVAPGTSFKTNPNMMKTLMANSFYPTLPLNVARETATRDPRWEGLTDSRPAKCSLGRGNPGSRAPRPPKIFFISWFRRDEKGKFIWPGFGENIRTRKWIIARAAAAGSEGARETPIGFVPGQGASTRAGCGCPRKPWRNCAPSTGKNGGGV